jgi:hypothetical protein
VGCRITPSKDRPGKTDKLPINPQTGSLASSTDPSTWGTFDQAREAVQRFRLQGVGFVFTDSDDDTFCGIDLDHCFDAAGNLASEAQHWVDALNSYTERSVSGTGLHVIVKAVLPPGGCRKDGIEMYNAGRFFVMTGDVFDGHASIEDRQEQVEAMHAAIFGRPEPRQNTGGVRPAPVNLADADLIARAERAPNGAKFTALMRGDTSGYDSPSEADLALTAILAFWTGGDSARVDSLFRQSGLFRPKKWDRKHFSDGSTYGQATVKLAIGRCFEFYSGNGREPTGLHTYRDAPEPPAWLDDDSLAAVIHPAQPAVKGSDRLTILSLRELLTRTWPKPVYVVKDLLPEGLTNFSGKSKIGKSWLGIQLGYAVGCGGVFLGQQVEQGRCLYVALEDSYPWLADRAQLQGMSTLDAQVDFVDIDGLLAVRERALLPIIRSGAYKLVVIDTLSRAIAADQNDNAEMTAALSAYQEAALAAHCAVVLVDHHNKMGAANPLSADAEPDPLTNILGATAKGAVPDCIWGLYKRSTGQRGFLLVVTGRRVPEQRLTLIKDQATQSWRVDDNPQQISQMTAGRAEIVDAVRELGGEASYTEVVKAVGKDRGNVYKQLQDMVNLGFLTYSSKRYALNLAE